MQRTTARQSVSSGKDYWEDRKWAQSLAPVIAIGALHNESEDQPCFHEVSVGHMFNELKWNMWDHQLMLGSGQRAEVLLSQSQLLQPFGLCNGSSSQLIR